MQKKPFFFFFFLKSWRCGVNCLQLHWPIYEAIFSSAETLICMSILQMVYERRIVTRSGTCCLRWATSISKTTATHCSAVSLMRWAQYKHPYSYCSLYEMCALGISITRSQLANCIYVLVLVFRNVEWLYISPSLIDIL